VPLEAAIVFAPAGEVVEAALRAVGPGGTVVTAGITMTPIPALEYEACLFHERQLRSVEANTVTTAGSCWRRPRPPASSPRSRAFLCTRPNQALRALREDGVAGTAVLDVAV
jgi:propanol-preferring alcohol dehydrogenase